MKQLKKNDLIAAIDLGSSYSKIVLGNFSGKIKENLLIPSNFELEKELNNKILKKAKYVISTGHLKSLANTKYVFNEAKILTFAFSLLNEKKGTLIDIGGQDLKVFLFENGNVLSSKINRRCASGTGSFLNFLSFKLSINKEKLNELCLKTKKFYPINNYCTVFSSFEIIEMLNKKIKKEEIARGIFHSMAMRIFELGPFLEPVFLTGGVVQHYPAFYDVMEEVLKTKIKKIKNPQFFQARGLYFFFLNNFFAVK